MSLDRPRRWANNSPSENFTLKEFLNLTYRLIPDKISSNRVQTESPVQDLVPGSIFDHHVAVLQSLGIRVKNGLPSSSGQLGYLCQV